MKKLVALTLAGAMVCALPVCAAESPSAAVVASSAAAVEAASASAGKSVGEYINNAVVEVPGLTEVTPLGQGGHVVINGAPSNVTFFLTKPSEAAVTSAKSQAQILGGKVLNVVGTTSQVITEFGTAQVNFYAKGVKAGQFIKVYQLINGEWVELKVSEIREDHVVVNMTSHGILAFIEVPEAVGTVEETKATAEPKATEAKETVESIATDEAEKADEVNTEGETEKTEEVKGTDEAEAAEEAEVTEEVKETQAAGVTAGAIN